MNKATFLRIAQHHLTALCYSSDNQVKTESPKVTALGQRILDLSLAYRTEFLSEEQLIFFSDELVKSCDAYVARVRNSAHTNEQQSQRYQLLDLLEQYTDLADTYDQLDHSRVVLEVDRLERSMRTVLLSIALPSAA